MPSSGKLWVSFVVKPNGDLMIRGKLPPHEVKGDTVPYFSAEDASEVLLDLREDIDAALEEVAAARTHRYAMEGTDIWAGDRYPMGLGRDADG